MVTPIRISFKAKFLALKRAHSEGGGRKSINKPANLGFRLSLVWTTLGEEEPALEPRVCLAGGSANHPCPCASERDALFVGSLLRGQRCRDGDSSC